jgi:hypothetical protein
MKNPTAKAKLRNRVTATCEKGIPSTGFPNPAPRPEKKWPAFAALVLAAAICAGCVGRMVNSVQARHQKRACFSPWCFNHF